LLHRDAPSAYPLGPLSPYGVSKLACERYLYYYLAQYGLPYVASRYSNVFGPRQDPHGEAGVVAILSGNLAEGMTSTINGTGEQTRDYVYVEVVTRANVLALEGEVPPGAYNVGTGSETSVNELYRLLLKISRKDLDPEHGPAKPGGQLRSSMDPTLAGRVIGWQPRGGPYLRSQGDPPLFWRSLRPKPLCGSKRRARNLVLAWEPQLQHGQLVTRGVEPEERCLLREAAAPPPPRSGVSSVLHPHPISPVLVAMKSL
jgi:GDP-D-mannose dehydratase